MVHWLKLNRLQRKVLWVILAMVVVPMLVAGAVASEWASSYFEARLAQWITEAARVDQIWLRAYQNDGLMLGQALAHDPVFRRSLRHGPVRASAALTQMAHNLGITLWQVETPAHRVLYASLPVHVQTSVQRRQHTALLKVRYHGRNMLAAVGITSMSTAAGTRQLVLGSLINRDFITELGQLTGLTTRLYYRSGTRYYDVFSKPGQLVPLTGLSAAAWHQIGQAHKSFYDIAAGRGRYRGLYVPVVDSAGRVEAILFSGLKRAGVDAFMTSRTALFLAISLAGLLIGGAAGVLLSRLVVRPIAHLRDAVLRLGGQDYRATVPISSNDELGDLGKAFNAMALRLQEARDEQQQAFQKDKLAALGEVSAALAHEIRNPIGVINTAGALLERSEDPAKNGELLRMIREESRRVSHLVQDFLQLSRHRHPNFQALEPTHPLRRAV
ncbi:MAG TPA: HAMP domain-containing protein, partial [Acidiferrobacteraceae bacterium]|nr:HAMP domain-containing protein [Acidiferrobacteraceae bacterium]